MRGSLLFVVLALTAAAPPANGQSLEDQLLAIERERQAAYAAGDLSVLKRHFADEYNHTNLRGGTTNREQELAFYRPGAFSLQNGTISDVAVHDYGDTAVLLGTVTWTGATYKPNQHVSIDLSGRFRVTRVYVKRDGRWQLAASHASQIAPAESGR